MSAKYSQTLLKNSPFGGKKYVQETVHLLCHRSKQIESLTSCPSYTTLFTSLNKKLLKRKKSNSLIFWRQLLQNMCELGTVYSQMGIGCGLSNLREKPSFELSTITLTYHLLSSTAFSTSFTFLKLCSRTSNYYERIHVQIWDIYHSILKSSKMQKMTYSSSSWRQAFSMVWGVRKDKNISLWIRIDRFARPTYVSGRLNHFVITLRCEWSL